MKDWEKRAREVLDSMNAWHSPATCRAAVALGVEMADARAEEIAAKIKANDALCDHGQMPGFRMPLENCLWCGTRRVDAAVARATIKKQESEFQAMTRGLPEPKTREQAIEKALWKAVHTLVHAKHTGPNVEVCPECIAVREAKAAMETK